MADQVREFKSFVWATDIEEPSGSRRIWRYMTLPSLFFMLFEKKLHFSRIWELDDLREGLISRAQINDLAVDLNGEGRLELLPTLVNMYRNFVAGCAISCWHANETESVAMWRLYTTGDDGITIQTTVSKLRESLESSDRNDFNFRVGLVRYVDHDEDVLTETAPECQTSLTCVFQKSREYLHEQEVRVVRVMPQSRPCSSKDLDFPLASLSFIERIVLSPRFPTWALPGLRAAISGFGVTAPVSASALQDFLRPR